MDDELGILVNLTVAVCARQFHESEGEGEVRAANLDLGGEGR